MGTSSPGKQPELRLSPEYDSEESPNPLSPLIVCEHRVILPLTRDITHTCTPNNLSILVLYRCSIILLPIIEIHRTKSQGGDVGSVNSVTSAWKCEITRFLNVTEKQTSFRHTRYQLCHVLNKAEVFQTPKRPDINTNELNILTVHTYKNAPRVQIVYLYVTIIFSHKLCKLRNSISETEKSDSSSNLLLAILVTSSIHHRGEIYTESAELLIVHILTRFETQHGPLDVTYSEILVFEKWQSHRGYTFIPAQQCRLRWMSI